MNYVVKMIAVVLMLSFVTLFKVEIVFAQKEYSKEEGMVQVIFNDGLIYLSLKGIIDFDEEKNRLQRKLEKIETEINKIQVKLKDDNFVNNAPEEDLRNSLRIPALNLDQPLLVSEDLPTKRAMIKDEDVCLHCGLCAERCPTGAWDMQTFLYEEAKVYS